MPSHRFPAALGAIGLAGLTLAGCGAGTHRSATTGGRSGGGTPTTTAPTTTASTAPSTTTSTLPHEQPGWRLVYETRKAIVTDLRSVALPDGHTVTLIRFHAGHFRLDLHVGSEDPPSRGLVMPAVAGDAVSPAERPRLLGAFNGGFMTATGSGGMLVDGQVLKPLVKGDASLVVDADGSVHVGVWGAGVPVPGERVESVRQNLVPLIQAGRVPPSVNVVADWGAVLDGVLDTARSAVGTDPAGDVVYAASMAAYPDDLVKAMQQAGVTNAMELDINPYWIQGDVAFRPGGTLVAAIPGQQRPADTYLVGWTRDFVAVVAR